jgi:hypothetical protein
MLTAIQMSIDDHPSTVVPGSPEAAVDRSNLLLARRGGVARRMIS